MRSVDKIEVTKEEFEAYLASHPEAPLAFDGMRYTHRVEMVGLIWNKPVAAMFDGKYYKLVDK